MSTITASTASSEIRSEPKASAPVLLRLLAMLLLFAAIAKGYAGWQDHTLTAIRWAQIGVEVGLGIWVGSGIKVGAAWQTSVVTFSLFAGVTLYEVFRQAPSCGCFGHASLPPTTMFLLDLGIVAALTIARPYRNGGTGRPKTRLVIAMGVICTGLLAVEWARLTLRAVASPSASSTNIIKSTAIGSGAGLPPLRSPLSSSSLQAPRADYVAIAISATTWAADLGIAPQGKAVTVLFRIGSPNHRLLQVRGLSTSCGCTSVPDPPQIIPAEGTVDMVLKYEVPDRAVSFESNVLITTDSPYLPPLKLAVKGAIR